MCERRKRRVHHAARQAFADVRIPEDATHESVAFFGQKKVRIYPLRRTHFCDLLDGSGTAPGVPVISTTLTQFFPTWLQLGCGDYTRPRRIAKRKIKNCKVHLKDPQTPDSRIIF